MSVIELEEAIANLFEKLWRACLIKKWVCSEVGMNNPTVDTVACCVMIVAVHRTGSPISHVHQWKDGFVLKHP